MRRGGGGLWATGMILAWAAAGSTARGEPLPVWVVQTGSTGLDNGESVAVDGLGDSYVTGGTSGDFGGSNQGSYDVFLAKYSPAGGLVWKTQFGTSGSDRAYGVASDRDGNAYVVGNTYGVLGGPNQGGCDAFLAKYSATGERLWMIQLGSADTDGANGVAVDGSGNAFVTGYTYGSLGGANQGECDAFLAKYSPTGMQLWNTQLGTHDTEYAAGVAVDGAGNAYIAGGTYGSLGGRNQGGQDAFLAKYSAVGGLVWASHLGTSGDDTVFGVAVDGSGNAYITGYTTGGLGGANQGSTDAFLAKYSATGELHWKNQCGTNAPDEAEGVAVDGVGNAYITGRTYGSLGATNQGSWDAFLSKYSPMGGQLWTTQLGTSGGDYAYGVAVDGQGNAYITGYTSGSLGGAKQGGSDTFLAMYAVPEPATLLLLALGGAGLIDRKKNRKKKKPEGPEKGGPEKGSEAIVLRRTRDRERCGGRASSPEFGGRRTETRPAPLPGPEKDRKRGHVPIPVPPSTFFGRPTDVACWPSAILLAILERRNWYAPPLFVPLFSRVSLARSATEVPERVVVG